MAWISLQHHFERVGHRGILLADAARSLLFALSNPDSGVVMQARVRRFYWPEEPRVTASERLEWEHISGRLNTRDPCRLASFMAAIGVREIDRCEQDPAQPEGAERASLEARAKELLPLIHPELDWREHPIIIHAQPMPAAFWTWFDGVSVNCTSAYQDDPEEPMQSQFVDWIGGTAEENWFDERTTYSAMEIEDQVSVRLIATAMNGMVAPRDKVERLDEFIKDAIARDLTQKAALELWRKSHKEKRHIFNSRFNEIHKEIKGFPPKVGRRPKLAKKMPPN